MEVFSERAIIAFFVHPTVRWYVPTKDENNTAACSSLPGGNRTPGISFIENPQRNNQVTSLVPCYTQAQQKLSVLIWYQQVKTVLQY
jgi:hypothetical protein